MTSNSDLGVYTSLSVKFMSEECSREVSFNDALDELKSLIASGFEIMAEEVNGEVASFCIYRNDDDKTFLKRLYTEKMFRNNGLATKLIGRLKERGVPISLFVASDNMQAIKYYEKLGGKEQFKAIELPAL